jgi:thymidylate synthase (FAD)
MNTNKSDIEALKEQQFVTKRATVENLEQILFEPIKVLDHGFIRVIDYMGDDAAIVQAARVSYGKGTKMMSQDKGLINYLMRHYHTTPFEMCEIKLHIKLPIFIARQWIRHRTANVNEYSARYSILDKEFYLPEPQNIAVQSTTNNQGRSNVLEPHQAQRVLDILREDALRCYDNYMDLLNVNEETQLPNR